MYAAVRRVLVKLLGFESFSPVHQEMLALILQALDLLSKPRALESSVLPDEMTLLQTLLYFEEEGHFELIAASFPACSSQLQQVRDAWARVKTTGVLHRRGLLCRDMTSVLDQRRRDQEAADARQARRGLRSCGLASCGATEVHVDHFKRCSACKTIVYCCKEHQLEHWPAHKRECKAARKAAAPEDQ
jgi:hypothetical protein